MELSRRDFLKVSGAAGLAFATTGLVGCSSGSNEKKEDSKETAGLLPAKIGYWGGTCEAEIMIAEANGYYKECGIDANVFKITSGTNELIANNEIDFFEAHQISYLEYIKGSKLSSSTMSTQDASKAWQAKNLASRVTKISRAKKLECSPRATWLSYLSRL